MKASREKIGRKCRHVEVLRQCSKEAFFARTCRLQPGLLDFVLHEEEHEERDTSFSKLQEMKGPSKLG